MGPPPPPSSLGAALTEGRRALWWTRDTRALLAPSAAMVAYTELVKLLAARRVCSSVTARKLMHVGCGPIFLLCWPLFSDGPFAAAHAAAAPLAITAFFTLVGLGVVKSEATVQSMSRTGARRELLRGPFLYGAVIVAATLFHWRRLTAVLAISCLCSGDGAADLVGRRLGHLSLWPPFPSVFLSTSKAGSGRRRRRHDHSQPPGARIPWCPQKSWAGTAGFVAAAVATSHGLARFLQAQGCLVAASSAAPAALAPRDLWARVLGTALAGAAAESLPVAEGWDNLLVFAAALLADRLVCRRRGLAL